MTRAELEHRLRLVRAYAESQGLDLRLQVEPKPAIDENGELTAVWPGVFRASKTR